MSERRLDAMVAVDLVDPSDWGIAIERLRGPFEESLKSMVGETVLTAQVTSVEVFLHSPNGSSPLEFEVELGLSGATWRDIREAAYEVLTRGAASAGVGLTTDAPETETTQKDASYEQQGVELVPA